MHKESTINEQNKVMESLRAFIDEHGFAPTERELCQKAGISSNGL